MNDPAILIYDLVPSLLSNETPAQHLYTPPHDYDFGLANLNKRVVDENQGDQHLIVYYATLSPEGVYSQPVAQRAFEISYPSTGLPRVEVVETIAWYRRDGQIHEVTKVLRRTYHGQRWLDWLQNKRSQIVAWLRWNVAAAMLANLPLDGMASVGDVMAAGGQFFGDHGALISAYIGGYAQAFPEAVAADSRPWLDAPWPGRPGVSIRDVFAEQLVYA